MMENPETLLEAKPVKDSQFISEVLMGLSRRQKALPPKFLYDKRGSEIFEEICMVEDYYPTRAERSILRSHAPEMAGLIGPGALLIEPGSGNGKKIRLLLKFLECPEGFVPIEISREILVRMTEELQGEFPELRVSPVWGDFTAPLEFPRALSAPEGKKVVFFPGSTIGNFAPDEAVALLGQFGKLMGPRGGLLIGADLKKEKERLIRAYDDSKGVTAAFNLNLLERLNREAHASFDPDNFFHEAIYNAELGRVEMHLVSKIAQLVRVNQTVFRFQEGESIHTESSYKYSVEEFADLCARARLTLRQTWQDEEKLFCVYYFERV